MTVEHVVPQVQGSVTTFDNLCVACRRCNECKGSATTARDPLTGDAVPLFHPRTQRWSEHFAWDAPGTHLPGLTRVGRATVLSLNMNNAVIVVARRRWVSVGWHPPES
jgi:hypothetical protein